MADFFSTRGISFIIDEIIKNTNEHLYLITPYLKLSDTLYERLKSLRNRNIAISIVYGKTEINPHQYQLLKALNCNIYFKENLHAKCYINEQEAIITSMNLHSFSEANNIEMGIKISKRKDKEAYTNCFKEILDLLILAKPISVTKTPQKKDIILERLNTQKVFVEALYKAISNKYPSFKGTSINNDIIFENFPFQNINITNQKGFVCFDIINKSKYDIKELREELQENLYHKLKNYRVYWNYPYDRIIIYHLKDISFKSLEEEIVYCLNAVDIFFDFSQKKLKVLSKST